MFFLSAALLFTSLVPGGTALPRENLSTSVTVPKPSNCTAAEAAWKAAGRCAGPPCGCTNQNVQTWAAVSFCNSGSDITEVSAPAFGQYAVDRLVNECRARGTPVESVQIQLSPPQAAFLKNLYDRDARIRQEQMAFFALQVSGGHIGLVLLVLSSILARKIHRDWTFFNFCISWIFSSIVFSLLLYPGTKGHTFDSPFGAKGFKLLTSHKCVIQASLINGAQVMTSCSTMALVIRLWLNLRTAIYRENRSPRSSRLISTALLLPPYLLFIIFAVPSGYIANNGTMTASGKMNIFYCTIQSDAKFIPFLRAVFGAPVVFLLVTCVFDALIIRIVYLHWRTFRGLDIKHSVSLSTLIRVTVFSIYRLALAMAYTIAMFSNQVSLGSSTNMKTGVKKSFVELMIPVPVDIMQATIPLVAFLILGTNKETMRSFMLRRREPRHEITISETGSSVTSTAGMIDAWRSKGSEESHYQPEKQPVRDFPPVI